MSEIVLNPIQVAPQPPIPRKLPTSQVCVVLGCTKQTLDTLRRRPDFPRAYRYSVKGRMVSDEQELLEWLERQRVGGPSDAA
jgi:hypothetical protein